MVLHTIKVKCWKEKATRKIHYPNININIFLSDRIGISKLNKEHYIRTFFNHANTETLLKSTVLTSVSTSLVYRAVFICQANIFCIFLNRSLGKHNTEIVN